EGGSALCAQIGLDEACRTGEDKVGRGGGHDDEVDVGDIDTGVFQRRLRRLGGELAGRHVGIGNVALPYAGTFDDPGIRRFDLTRREVGRELVVGHDAWRQIAARPYYLGVRHSRFQKPGYGTGSDKSLESFTDCAAAACKLWRRWSMALVVPPSRPLCTASRARCNAQPKA